MVAAIEVSFEPRVPVVGQIFILEALDFIYSLMALAEAPFTAPPSPSVDEIAVDGPGKLLARDNLLTVESVRNGSVMEILSGLPAALSKADNLIRWCITNIALRGAPMRIDFIRNQLLPAIEALKKQGLSDRAAERVLRKATQYLDDVITELTSQGKLQIVALDSIPSLRSPCPTCSGRGMV
jgi:hypothetical protein